MKITQHIYDTPSGTVRGYAICVMKIGKKEQRIAHCYFMVDKPTEVTLNIPTKKMTPAEVGAIANALMAFQAEIANV